MVQPLFWTYPSFTLVDFAFSQNQEPQNTTKSSLFLGMVFFDVLA